MMCNTVCIKMENISYFFDSFQFVDSYENMIVLEFSLLLHIIILIFVLCGWRIISILLSLMRKIIISFILTIFFCDYQIIVVKNICFFISILFTQFHSYFHYFAVFL